MRALLAGGGWADEKLRNWGIVRHPDQRLARALRFLERAFLRADRDGHTQADAGRFSDSLRTILEHYLIVRAVASPTGLVADRLAVMARGGDSPGEQNTAARDAQFELAVAAALSLAGVGGVHLDEPDIRIPAGWQDVGVAVKRLSSPRKLRHRLRGASKQLRRHATPGIIVLSLDVLVDLNDLDASSHRIRSVVEECAALLETWRVTDTVFGVWGMATAFLTGNDPSDSADYFRLWIDHHVHLIAPEHEHARLRSFAVQIGGNLRDGITRELSTLSALTGD